jgi:hypothetical protein
MAELIVPPALRERHRRGFLRYLETEQERVIGRRIAITGMRKDGTEFPVEPAITRIDLPGEPMPAAVEATEYFVVAEALTNATRHCRARVPAQLAQSAPEGCSKLVCELYGGFDLDASDRHALHVDPERHAERSAVRHQLGGRREGLLVGGRERVGCVLQVVLDPPRHVDAKPA